MMSVELLQAIEKLIPDSVEAAHPLKRLVRLLADAGGRLRLLVLSQALGGGQAHVFAAARGWNGLRWNGLGYTAEVWLAPWVARQLGLAVPETCPALTRLDGQDDDEPTAYHRPVEPGGLDPLALPWSIDDEWELANVLWDRIELGTQRPAPVLPRDCAGVSC